MDAPLNEAFASKILQGLWSVPMCKNTFLHIIKYKPGLDINKITDADFKVLTGKEAAKINSKSVWKFWTINGPSQCVMITHSNSLFDKRFEVNRSRRLVKYIPGASVIAEQIYLEYAQLGKRYLDRFKTCYVIDVDDVAIRNERTEIKLARKNARNGAVALMSDTEIKKENIKRYTEQIRKNKISDGSEFNLVNSVTKYFADTIKRVGPIPFFFYCVREGFLINYLSAYADSLVECIRLLNKNGMILKANEPEPEEKWVWWETEAQKYNKLRDTLSKAADNVIELLKRARPDDHFTRGLNIILNDPKTCQEYYDFIKSNPDITNADDFLELMHFVQTINVTIPKAFTNPNISRDIMNFDTFVMQMHGLKQLQDGFYNFDESVSDVGYYNELMKAGEDVSKHLGYRIRGINVGYFKRIEAFIRMIQNI